MVRAAFAIFLFMLVLMGLFALPAQAGDEKILDETAFALTDPPRPLPAFLFEDEKGRTLDMKDFRGRYVLINIWATFCGPCVAEMGKLDALSAKLDPKKWAIIALDEDHDGTAVARAFYHNHNIKNLQIYNDRTGRAPFVLGMRGMPTTYLVNPNGDEIARLEGPAEWDKDSMIAWLNARAAH